MGLRIFSGDHTELNRTVLQIEQLKSQANPDDAQLTVLIERKKQISGQLIEGSLLGRMGHAVEPVVKPLGWDWKIGVGAIASFPAREVIIATLGTIYSLGSEVGEDDPSLMNAIRDAQWPDG